MSLTAGGWAKPDGELGLYIAEESEKTLDSYREQPRRVAEDANGEDDTAGGGYARRQLFELIQNSADALSPIGGGSEREYGLERGRTDLLVLWPLWVRIPVKPITRSGMKPITESGQADHQSERSDAGW